MKIPQTIHLYRPTIGRVRAAVQSLAGHNHMPFDGTEYETHRGEKMFHGLIDPFSLSDLIDSAVVLWHTDGPAGPTVVIPDAGVEFVQTDAVRGAIIFGKTSDLLQVQSQ